MTVPHPAPHDNAEGADDLHEMVRANLRHVETRKLERLAELEAAGFIPPEEE